MNFNKTQRTRLNYITSHVFHWATNNIYIWWWCRWWCRISP